MHLPTLKQEILKINSVTIDTSFFNGGNFLMRNLNSIIQFRNCVFMVYIGRNLQNKESVAFIILMLKDVLYT